MSICHLSSVICPLVSVICYLKGGYAPPGTLASYLASGILAAPVIGHVSAVASIRQLSYEVAHLSCLIFHPSSASSDIRHLPSATCPLSLAAVICHQPLAICGRVPFPVLLFPWFPVSGFAVSILGHLAQGHLAQGHLAHLPSAIGHPSSVSRDLSPAVCICHLPSVICRLSLSSVFYHRSSVICHLSSVICPLASVICYLKGGYAPPELWTLISHLAS